MGGAGSGGALLLGDLRAYVVHVDALRLLEHILERRLGHFAGREQSTTWSRTITDVAIDMTVERGAAGR
jgi:hypothetical protein